MKFTILFVFVTEGGNGLKQAKNQLITNIKEQGYEKNNPTYHTPFRTHFRERARYYNASPAYPMHKYVHT